MYSTAPQTLGFIQYKLDINENFDHSLLRVSYRCVVSHWLRLKCVWRVNFMNTYLVSHLIIVDEYYNNAYIWCQSASVRQAFSKVNPCFSIILTKILGACPTSSRVDQILFLSKFVYEYRRTVYAYLCVTKLRNKWEWIIV